MGTEATRWTTFTLSQVQQPARVERLLESYILHEANLPWGAYRMRSAATVPRELRGPIMQAVKLGRTWSCWTDGTQTWLFTAEMSLELSQEHGAPVLQVNLYSDDGSLRGSGTMMTNQAGKWCHCAD